MSDSREALVGFKVKYYLNKKVVFVGKTRPLCLTNGKTYKVLSVERGWYRIVDDSFDDYLYPPDLFIEVEEA